MNINTKTMISITTANQNFSKVARLVDEEGSAVILKHNLPRYLVIPFAEADEEQLSSDEDVCRISKRILAKNRNAYKDLAK
jgi:antitoxin Phd